ncbi:hypothetical protein YC2023_092610 [Brassica napus]
MESARCKHLLGLVLFTNKPYYSFMVFRLFPSLSNCVNFVLFGFLLSPLLLWSFSFYAIFIYTGFVDYKIESSFKWFLFLAVARSVINIKLSVGVSLSTCLLEIKLH